MRTTLKCTPQVHNKNPKIQLKYLFQGTVWTSTPSYFTSPTHLTGLASSHTYRVGPDWLVGGTSSWDWAQYNWQESFPVKTGTSLVGGGTSYGMDSLFRPGPVGFVRGISYGNCNQFSQLKPLLVATGLSSSRVVVAGYVMFLWWPVDRKLQCLSARWASPLSPWQQWRQSGWILQTLCKGWGGATRRIPALSLSLSLWRQAPEALPSTTPSAPTTPHRPLALSFFLFLLLLRSLLLMS